MAEARLLLVCAVALAAGSALLLTELRWFRRPSYVRRLQPHLPTANGATPPGPSLRSFVLPLADAWGSRLATMFGVRTTVARRLAQLNDTRSAAEFRLHQGLVAIGAMVASALLLSLTRPPLVITALVLVGVPLLAFLVIEQRLSQLVNRRQALVFQELPIFSEQLAMLLSAGFSLGAALTRLAERGDGVIATDLRSVRDRMRHGVSAPTALAEWAQRMELAELDRLVLVVRAGSESSDLGRLVSAEARAVRLEAQRRLNEIIERRGQQVWVPVTVATLVPGVIFLCIPFLQALQLFSGL